MERDRAVADPDANVRGEAWELLADHAEQGDGADLLADLASGGPVEKREIGPRQRWQGSAD